MPWRAARLCWSLLSTGVLLLAVLLILRNCKLTTVQGWVLGSGVLLFSPISSGLSTGTPSVISCGLILAAVYLALERRLFAAAIFLGLAHSIKPQLSIAGVAVFLVLGYWRTAALSLLIPVLAVFTSFLRIMSFDEYRLWLATLRDEIASTFQPGGLQDPSPANYFSYHLVNEEAILSIWLHDSRMVSAIVWLTVAVLAGAYFWCQRTDGGNRNLRSIAFFCALALVPLYHRYYDLPLLIGIIPFLLQPAAGVNDRKAKAAIWGCLLLLLFPLQAILATALPGLSPATPVGFLGLRHQPVIVLLLCLLIIPWSRAIWKATPRSPVATE